MKSNYIGMVHSSHTDSWRKVINTADADQVARWLKLCRATGTVAMLTVNMGDDPDQFIGEMTNDN